MHFWPCATAGRQTHTCWTDGHFLRFCWHLHLVSNCTGSWPTQPPFNVCVLHWPQLRGNLQEHNVNRIVIKGYFCFVSIFIISSSGRTRHLCVKLPCAVFPPIWSGAADSRPLRWVLVWVIIADVSKWCWWSSVGTNDNIKSPNNSCKIEPTQPTKNINPIFSNFCWKQRSCLISSNLFL